MSLLFLSAISIAVLSVSAIGAPCCSPEAVPAGCAVAVARPPGACSTAAVCALTVAPKSNAAESNPTPAPLTSAIIFRIPAPSRAGRSPKSIARSLFTLEGLRPVNHALLIPQRLNRLQLGRLICRQISKKQSRRARNHKRQHHAHRRHRHPQISGQKRLRDYRHQQPDQNSQHRTAPADQKRLRQKLIHDLLARRPDSLSNTNLPRALRHRHQHDVHNPNSADQQRDKRNHNQYNRQRQRNISRRRQYRRQRLHVVLRRARMSALQQLRKLLQSRHPSAAEYNVQTLTAILTAARDISLALTIVLIVIAFIALLISGIGIMNIMLVTVTERTREIGIRKAIGAARKEIMYQFLTEAFLISGGGAVLGILIGLLVPVVAQSFLPGNLRVPVSTMSVVLAFVVSCSTGLFFGYLPANQAAKLQPIESLRYE